MTRSILFITGTRADFGKLKPLISAAKAGGYDTRIFATGMHMQALYGLTHYEIQKAGFAYYPYMNNCPTMDGSLASTIDGLGRYIRENPPDLLVIHGDRLEALAGACVGMYNNILTAHIEGGEVSGTVDESMRHAVSKLAQIHFVANEDAAARLRQMGEYNIFVIGSPDIDIMLSPDLPSFGEVRRKYDIPANYSIFTYHPVTTEVEQLKGRMEAITAALLESGLNYVIIYPNNDQGCEIIMEALKPLPYRQLPSMRFEYFLTLLKNAYCIIGNSSAGIREAPVYGIPTVNLGNRQNGRACLPSILNVVEEKVAILDALKNLPQAEPCLYFGRGNSAELFIQALNAPGFWDIPKQKHFRDIVCKH